MNSVIKGVVTFEKFNFFWYLKFKFHLIYLKLWNDDNFYKFIEKNHQKVDNSIFN